MKHNDRDPLAGLGAPRTPDGLKGRVLQAANEALGDDPPRTRWDDLWDSRSLRAAWSVAVVGLIVAHVVISLPPRPTQSRNHRPVETTGRAQLDALRDDLALPAVTVSPRAQARVMGQSSEKTTDDAEEPSNDSRKDEVS